MKVLPLMASAAILVLGACDAGIGGGGNPSEANLTEQAVEGGVMLSGNAGANFDDDDIRSLLVEPVCTRNGMSIAEISIDRQADGGALVSARCG